MVRRLLQQTILVIALSGIAICAIAAPLVADPVSTSSTKTVTFSVDLPEFWIDGTFPVDVAWNDYFKASKDDVVAISYKLTPRPATLEIMVPLSDYLGWFGFGDITIPVPLGNTLLGMTSLSLTSLAGIPSWLASLDLRLKGTINTYDLACNSASVAVQTDASTMVWDTWATRTAYAMAYESPGGSVRATFSYSLGIGLVLSVIGIDLIEIIPLTTVISSIGYPSIDTLIDVPTRAGVSSTAVAGATIAAVVVVGIVVMMLLRRKKGDTSAATIPKEEPPKA